MWAASPARNSLPITHRLGDEAAQRRNGLFDRRAGDNSVGHVLWASRLELLPEALVWPFFQFCVEIALNVVAAQHRSTHRSEREAAAVIAITQFRERRCLRHDAEPAERIALIVGLRQRDRNR